MSVITADGSKATRINGYNGRLFLIETRNRIDIVEMKPGVSIEEFDRCAYQPIDNVRWHFHASADKMTKKREWSESGWFIDVNGNTYTAKTKAETIWHLRAEIKGLKKSNAYNW